MTAGRHIGTPHLIQRWTLYKRPKA